MALILPHGSKPDNLERRLRSMAALDGTVGIPSAQEIIDAIGTGAGRSRRAARLQNWAAGALRRIGAKAEALAMARRAEHTSRGESAPQGSGTSPATDEDLAEAGL